MKFKKGQEVTDKLGYTGVVTRESYFYKKHFHNHVDVKRNDEIGGLGEGESFIYNESSLVYDEEK